MWRRRFDAGAIHGLDYGATFVFGGLVDQGVFSDRRDDPIGISLAWAKIGSPLIQTEALDSTLELPLAMDAVGAQSNEVLLEGRHDLKIASGLLMMPDLQYIVRPSAATKYPDAVGITLHLAVNL